jgi:U-box domain
MLKLPFKNVQSSCNSVKHLLVPVVTSGRPLLNFRVTRFVVLFGSFFFDGGRQKAVIITQHSSDFRHHFVEHTSRKMDIVDQALPQMEHENSHDFYADDNGSVPSCPPPTLLSDQDGSIQHEESITIPPEFVCPITLEIMEFPMRSPHGHVFERAAIQTWLAGGGNVCPLTRRPLHSLSPDYRLLSQIHIWRVHYKLAEPKQMFRLSFGQPQHEPLQIPGHVALPILPPKTQRLSTAQLVSRK